MELDNRFNIAAGNKTMVIFVIFLIALVPRLYRLGSKNVWMDEGKQAEMAAVNPLDFDLADRAARIQQPPIDIFLQSISIMNFGYNETGIRMQAAILGAVAAVLFFLVLQRIIPNRPAVLLGTLAFIFHPFLIRYSQEGRPISTGIFFSLLYLYFLLESFHPSRSDRKLLRPFFILTAVQVGFFLSVGLQPVVFLLASSICLAPNLMVKERRTLTLFTYLSTAAAFIVSLPIIQMTISYGAGYNSLEQTSILDMLKNIGGGFDYVTVSNIAPFYKTILADYGLFFAAALIAGTIGFIFNPNRRRYTFPAAYFTVFFLIFPLIYTVIFRSQISLNIIKQRYYLTFAPVCLALMALAVGLWLSLDEKAASLSRRWRHVPAVILAALFIYSFVPNLQSVSQVYKAKKPEWKKMYDIFLYDSEPGDMAYMLNLVRIGRWNPFFRARAFYYSSHHERPVSLREAQQIPADLKNPELWKSERNIYIVTRYGWEKIKKDFFKGVEGVDVFLFGQLSLIRIKKNPTTKENFISVLRTLKAKLPPHENNYFLYEILISIDLDKGNIESARKNLEVLEAMPGRKLRNKLIDRFKKRIEQLSGL